MPQFVIKNQEGEYLSHLKLEAGGGYVLFDQEIWKALKFSELLANHLMVHNIFQGLVLEMEEVV